ncbi:Aldehyde dehydrogenase, dimeric NADP-preferring [Porphyridium purpureum]|uniref:Aldehyde dehydrogenase n=1 Tax=Porphyridium purpureum TaxID=35688 RepID=A0A5J4YL40_PORPP|nr:Aldehyde dehydrogenase, dimeric NADP-preferring [Porphyridium purpureum]|eukprot:POR8540..scf210_14
MAVGGRRRHGGGWDVERAGMMEFAALQQGLRGVFETGRTADVAWRERQLLALERMMAERENELADALMADLGKPRMEAWFGEIGMVMQEAKYLRRNLRKWAARRRVSTPLLGLPARSWTLAEPLGLVLIISPWNYPLQLPLAGLAAVLAAGNCAVIKPSELAPASSALLARLVAEYLDPECVKVVTGAVHETTCLLEMPWDHILYTGGGAIGRIVLAAAAKHLTPVTLELGGKSPCVVMADADLSVAARRIAWGKFMNAGQTCIAPDYVILVGSASLEKQLVAALQRTITEMFGEEPEQSESFGRIVNARHFERVLALIQDDRVNVAVGGHANADSRYIAPTVLTDVSADCAAMQEEIFGPVLPVMRMEDLESAMRFIRARDKPLAAYLFTKDAAVETRFEQQVSCGSMCINDTMFFMSVPELPFGGVGASGMGCYTGQHGFNTFSHNKAVMRRAWWPDLALRYAPYSTRKLEIFQWAVKLSS